jgi:hypothetical protein
MAAGRSTGPEQKENPLALPLILRLSTALHQGVTIMSEDDLRILAFLQREREAFQAETPPDRLFATFAAYRRRFGALDLPLMIAGAGHRAEEVAVLLMDAALRRGVRTSYPEFCRAMGRLGGMRPPSSVRQAERSISG